MHDEFAGDGVAGDELFMRGESPAIKGEKALWTAVITQALMDAGSNSSKRDMRLIKAQAISWLTGMSEDFIEVCMMAQLHPAYVRDRALKAIKNGCQWREYNPNSYRKPKKRKRISHTRDRMNAQQPLETKSLESNVIVFPIQKSEIS